MGTSLSPASCFWEAAGDSKFSLSACRSASAALPLLEPSEVDGQL